MGGEKPKKAPDIGRGEGGGGNNNIPRTGAELIKKSPQLPKLKSTPYLDYLKKEIDDYGKKAIELINAGRPDEAFFVFKSIMDKKDFYEKKGIIIDNKIIKGIILCAITMVGYYLENGSKILNSDRDNFELPKIKPNKTKTSPLLSMRANEDRLRLNLEDIYKIYDPSYAETLKVKTAASKKNIIRALPFFAGSIKFTSYLLEYNKFAADTPLKQSPIAAALQFSASVNKILDTVNFNDLLKDENLSKKDKENLSHFFRERASLLGSVILKRDEPIWAFTNVSRNPELSPTLEHKSIKPIRVHMEERAMLGLIKSDPIIVLEAVTDHLAKNLTLIEEKELASLCFKLANSMKFFKDHPQYFKNKNSAPLELSDIFSDTETPKKRINEAQKIFRELKILIIKVSGSEARKNDENFQRLANALKTIPNWENLVQKIMESKQNEEWQKAENGDKSVDPRVESEINLNAIKLFTKAIKLNPESDENYVTLLDFLKKIKFDDKIEIKFRKKMEEITKITDAGKKKDAFVNLGKELADEINMTIGARTPAPKYEKRSWIDKLSMEPGGARTL